MAGGSSWRGPNWQLGAVGGSCGVMFPGEGQGEMEGEGEEGEWTRPEPPTATLPPPPTGGARPDPSCPQLPLPVLGLSDSWRASRLSVEEEGEAVVVGVVMPDSQRWPGQSNPPDGSASAPEPDDWILTGPSRSCPRGSCLRCVK